MATPQQATAKAAKLAPTKTDKPKAEKKGTEIFIPEIKSKALSKDVGPAFVRIQAKVDQDTAQAEDLANNAKRSKAAAMADLTLAIIKATKADTAINLALVTDTSADAKRDRDKLFAQIYVATGLKTVAQVGDKKRLVWSPEVQDLFPATGESTEAGTPGAAKATLRSNVSHAYTHAMHAALSIVERNISAEMDKATGTLKISGPEVQKQFGVKEVALNEKRTVVPTDKKGKASGDPIELKQIPSYSALRREAEVRHGKVARGPVTNDRRIKTTDPQTAVREIALALVKAIEALKEKPNAETVKALKAVESAIDPLV